MPRFHVLAIQPPLLEVKTPRSSGSTVLVKSWTVFPRAPWPCYLGHMASTAASRFEPTVGGDAAAASCNESPTPPMPGRPGGERAGGTSGVRLRMLRLVSLATSVCAGAVAFVAVRTLGILLGAAIVPALLLLVLAVTLVADRVLRTEVRRPGPKQAVLGSGPPQT